VSTSVRETYNLSKSSHGQIGDLFTKGLSRVLFQGLRKKLTGSGKPTISFEGEYGGNRLITPAGRDWSSMVLAI
jgi:hypothetical protein